MLCTYQNRLDYIAAYVRGALPETEQETFEAHFLGCDECLANIRLMEKTAITMRHYGKTIFAENLRITWSERLKTWWEELPLSPQWKSAIPALATYLVIIGILSTGYIWLKPNLSMSGFGHTASSEITTGSKNSALINLQHYDWTQPVSGMTPPELGNQLAEAQRFYQERDYRSAANRLIPLVEQFPQSPEARLYLGISQLSLNHNHTALAIQNLEILIQSHPDLAAARWYLAQGYIKESRFDAARQQLTALKKQNDSYFGPQAEKLLAKLNK